jgi:hypothetical protein
LWTDIEITFYWTSPNRFNTLVPYFYSKGAEMDIRKIKMVVLAIFATSVTTAYATGAGFYFGGMAGQSNIHQKAQNVQTGTTPPTVYTKPTSTGFGGRIFMGGNINQYGAIEGGYTYYGTATYKPSPSALCGNPSVKESGLDLVGKGMIPFNNFDVFAKAGVAYLTTSSSGSLSNTSSSGPCGGGSNTNNGVRPTGSLGASYDITPSWVADLSWTHVFSGGGAVQQSDLIALGISYHFVDHYVGQFLA